MKTAIIGGSGRMGQWFGRFLLSEGHQVLLTGRSESKLCNVRRNLNAETTTDISQVRQADVIIISVPLDVFEEVVLQLAPHTHGGQIIVDITSLKATPVDIMHRYIKSGITLGMHPVFGPGARSLVKLNFVLTPTDEPESALAEKIKDYLEKRGAHVSLMTPREHDEMMTVILGLAHFIAIVSADSLLSRSNFQQMKEIGGTTFKVLYTLVESVISEDPGLYATLQMDSPGIIKIEEEFRQNVETWASLVKNRDREAFINRMNALKITLEKTDPNFERAYENMYKMTKDL